jgi:glycosyltransferase involved in cell wall biosynthesis
MSGIHQFVPMLHRGDAVGRHTLRLREAIEGRGIRSNIYVELVDPDTESDSRPLGAYEREAERGDVLVYQFATASDMAPWLGARNEPLVVNYHNVTPPEFYAPWENAMARHQLRAQHELRHLAPRAALGLAVSAFNEAELREAGYARTASVPPAAMLPIGVPVRADVGADVSVARAAHRTRRGARWICVGRLAPNKSIELAVAALAIARAHHDPDATLQVVGRPVVPSYTEALHRCIDEMGLHGAVHFAGALGDDELVAAMAAADVLVVTSRHEGFGVPVLEAMSVGLPVVAAHAGALPEVVGDAGLLVDAADPWELSGAVARVLADAELRESLAAAGGRRLAALDLATAADRAVDLIAPLSA